MIRLDDFGNLLVTFLALDEFTCSECRKAISLPQEAVLFVRGRGSMDGEGGTLFNYGDVCHLACEEGI